jgi:hypothetical protein
VSTTGICASDVLLAELLKELTLQTDLRTLRGRLGQLMPRVAEEFANEEAAGGLHDEIRTLDPTATYAVQRLVADHANILSRADEILELCECSTVRLDAVRKRCRGLAWRVRNHQRNEIRLMLEPYYRDVGGH